MARAHYLHLSQSNFTSSVNGTVWISAVIDLYANNSYTNYSVVQSNYGLNSVEPILSSTPNNTWVGMTWVGNNVTNTGYIQNNRYIDTSGALNVIDYSIVAPDFYGNVTLDYYTSDIANAIFPAEWNGNLANIVSVGLQSISTDRYVILNLNFDSNPELFDFYLRVEIGPPIMSPLYGETQKALQKLPSWMAMQEPAAQFDATPQLATPSSTGGAFVNAMAGEFLDDLVSQITYRNMQLFIGTADINQKSQLWKSSNIPQYSYQFQGDGIECAVAVDDAELYKSLTTDDIVFWDENNQNVFSNKEYSTFTINEKVYAQELIPVWNAFDDLGLLVSLARLPNENNIDFKARILDVFLNPMGTGMVQFQTAIRRELSMWQLYGSTPDSNFLGATPIVLNMWDLENPVNGFVDTRGLPTQQFLKLADYLAAAYPSTWGYLKWDQAYADLAGPHYEGYSVLPLLLDATPPSTALMQAGVGGLDDLKINHPQPLNGPHAFEATVTVRGNQMVPQNQYSPVNIEYTIQGTANQYVYNNPVVQTWFTLNFTLYDGSQIYYSFTLSSQSDVSASTTLPTAASIGALKIFAADGSTDPSLQLQYKSNGTLTGFRILASTISTLSINVGQWNPTSNNYINVPATDDFLAWFSNDPTQQIDYTGYLTGSHSGPTMLTITNNSTNSGSFPQVSLSMQSTVTNSVLGTWYSIRQSVMATINDSGNITTTQTAVVPIPNVNWSNFLASPANQQYIITFVAATAQNADGSTIALDSSYIYVNNSNNWVGETQVIDGNTQNISVTTGTGSLYPYLGATYQMFESAQPVIISGIVDENGPWLNGYAPNVNNDNYLLSNLNLGRSDFNIPQTSEYQPTWIGVQSSNDTVITWLTSNTIVENASYQFQQNSLFARLNPIPEPQWNPLIHSGTFFEEQDEFYLYADPKTVIVTGNSTYLPSRVMQGAPIIVQDSAGDFLNQVCFYPDATPYGLTLTNTEIVNGTGTNLLYSAYNNIENLVVKDALGNILTVSVSGNTITTNTITDYNDTYTLTYSVVNSFFADNNAVSQNEPTTYLQFSKSDTYTITYESSVYNSATPIPINLNPLYSSFTEGFLFISNEEYQLSYVSAVMSPSVVLSDPSDYAVVSLRSYDLYGNPKPKQTFSVSTTFGQLAENTITTNNDGYASTILYGSASTNTLNPVAFLFIAGNGLSESIPFHVKPINTGLYKMYTTVSQQSIRANGTDLQMVSGLVRDSNYNPIPFVTLEWNLGRSLFDLYAPNGQIASSGTLTTNADGTFVIGPFTASTIPGYWFLSIYATENQVYTNIYDESQSYDAAVKYDGSTSSIPHSVTFAPIGDVVFWLEYADNTLGNGSFSGLPTVPTQFTTPLYTIPTYTSNAQNPLYYNNIATPNAIVPPWLPPGWFALPYFDQWQYGLYKVNENISDYSAAQAINAPPHPDEKSI